MTDDQLLIRIKLQGARQAQLEASGVAVSIKGIGVAGDAAAAGLTKANRSGFLFQQMMFTTRRVAYGGTIGLFALGAAATKMGFSFNAAMEGNEILLASFLGSTRAAKKELKLLFDLAATGPFEFRNLTNTATQFLAVGFSIRQTNAYLRTLSDTAAGLNLGGSDIERLAIIFGQIKSSGRLLGNDMLQLSQARIPIRPILKRELDLSKAQMGQLASGQLSIPSEIAIPAIMRGLSRPTSEGGFRGLSRKLQGTFSALTATAHDYASSLFGTVTMPLFLRTEAALKNRLNPLLLSMGTAFKAGGWSAMIAELDRGVGANGRVVEAWNEMRDSGVSIGRIVTGTIIPAFIVLWATLGLGSPPMRLLIWMLGTASHHTTILQVVLGLLAARFVYTRTVALAFAISAKLVGANLFTLTGTTKKSSAAMKLYALWVYRSEIAQKGAARASALWGKTLKLLAVAFSVTGRAAAAAWILATGPIGLIVLGVAALAAGLVYLYFKWSWFHDKVNATFSWVKSNWPLLLAILTGPIGLAVLLIVKQFDRIKAAARGALNFVIRGWNGISFTIPGFDPPGPGPKFGGFTLGVPKIPMLAQGGRILGGGSAIVGERGPELVHLGRGATVAPLKAGSIDLARMIQIVIHATTGKITLDGREVGEAVFKYEAQVAEAL